jgi:hypothetical protein
VPDRDASSTCVCCYCLRELALPRQTRPIVSSAHMRLLGVERMSRLENTVEGVATERK